MFAASETAAAAEEQLQARVWTSSKNLYLLIMVLLLAAQTEICFTQICVCSNKMVPKCILEGGKDQTSS